MELLEINRKWKVETIKKEVLRNGFEVSVPIVRRIPRVSKDVNRDNYMCTDVL